MSTNNDNTDNNDNNDDGKSNLKKRRDLQQLMPIPTVLWPTEKKAQLFNIISFSVFCHRR